MTQHAELTAQMGGLDPLNVPVAGESLTQDPESKQPFEKPPTFTNVEEATQELFFNMTDEENLDQIVNLMRADVPIEDIAQVMLFSGFREGLFNPDLMLLMLEPTMYILLWVADYAGVSPVLSPESDIDFVDEEGEELGGVSDVSEVAVPESVSPTLLGTIRERLDTEEQQEDIVEEEEGVE